MLIQIRNWSTGKVIFELDKEDNTIKKTVEAAVRKGISLREADLRCADLHGADLRGADLSYANLDDANLEDSYLSGADLTGANIEYCSFDGACLDNTIMPDFPMACPETGSFIGYKKIVWTREYFDDDFIVKLEIPEDAKRSSAFSNKCRCSKAKVLEIRNIRTDKTFVKVTNKNMHTCIYKVGEYVYPDSFDECRWHECSNGIHFFMTEDEALNY